MRTKLLAVGVSLASLVSASVEQSRFTSRADLVTVYASVLSRGAPLWTLDRGDFEVTVDGKKRDIVQFAREAQPLKVAIVLDRSASYFKGTLWSPTAAKGFVSGLRPEDVVSISRLARELQPLTGNPADLFRAIDTSESDDGSPIWSAVTRAVVSLENLSGRRAVLMFTDGGDVSMKAAPPALARRAQEAGVTLYLGLLDVPVSFRIPADEMRLQYLLGFQPEAFDGRFHRLRVRVPAGDVDVQAREGYLAVR